MFTLTGGGSTTLQVAPAGPHGPALTDGAISPDGSTVVGEDMTDRFLFTVPSTGGALTPIRGTARFIDPSFFPDGRRLLAVRQQWHPVGVQIYSMDLDGSHRRAIPNTRLLHGPSISPDGRWIVGSQAVYEPPASSRRWPRFGIFMIRTNGRRLHRVGTVASVAQTPEPVFSPNGRQIALTTYREPGLRSQLLVMSTDGKAVRRIPTHGVYVSHPSWGPSSPDALSSLPAPGP
jgi:Tol biopolymer transport system component